MTSLYLVTHSTAGYLWRMRPYLESLAAHWPRSPWCLTVDFDAPPEWLAEFTKTKFARVPKVAGSPENTDSLQHGAFLDYVRGRESDVMVYTDGDIVMQRAPTTAELALFERVPDGTVLAGWNSGPDETLAIEGGRLWPRTDPAAAFGELVRAARCYNIGVIAATRGTWARIHTHYMEQWDKCLATFGAQQRQQWLVCLVIAQLGLDVRVLPYQVHMHGCYPLPAGGAVAQGVATYQGAPVLFRHHL